MRRTSRQPARRSVISALIAILIAAPIRPANAQSSACGPCEYEWAPGFTVPSGGVNEGVRALASFNDGRGEALYVGGDFTRAGDTDASRIARWDGQHWSALANGVSGSVYALAAFDDGTGLAVYAGGSFQTASGLIVNNIARWDGAAWHPLVHPFSGVAGVNGTVHALTVFDDGRGPALYVGGSFTAAGGVSAPRIARWSGTTWEPLGTGTDNSIDALAVFDDGRGSALYAAGTFSVAGGTAAERIARWDGAQWERLGAGLDNTVSALTVHDEGTGWALYAGGSFTTAGGQPASRVARWDGAAWSALGEGTDRRVAALAVYDDGGGPSLYAGGEFTTAGGIPASRIASWDGSAWSPVGAGVVGSTGSTSVSALAVLGNGVDSVLFFGGSFWRAGSVRVLNIVGWNGTDWIAASEAGLGIDGWVMGLHVHDDGNGASLYAGGPFLSAGSAWIDSIARLAGDRWEPLGSGLTNWHQSVALDMATFDDGSGPALFVGGSFHVAGGIPVRSIARWDGTTWSGLGGLSDVLPTVRGMAVFDDGTGDALYVGGRFRWAGGTPVNHIARWNGQTWSDVGGGMTGGDTLVAAADVVQVGTETAFYAAGTFQYAGGIRVENIAKWDGQTWSPVGFGGIWGGTNTRVYSIEGFDDGAGPALYAGGRFYWAGGVSVNNIAKWDGTAWSPLGSGLNAEARAMCVFDDGTGPALYVAGQFSTAGGMPARGVAKWDGVHWHPLGAGVNANLMETIQPFDDGSGPALYVGGVFSIFNAGLYLKSNIAKWACPPVVPGDVNGDGRADSADVAPFVGVLLDPGAAASAPCRAADVNRDGRADGLDVPAFVALLLGP